MQLQTTHVEHTFKHENDRHAAHLSQLKYVQLVYTVSKGQAIMCLTYSAPTHTYIAVRVHHDTATTEATLLEISAQSGSIVSERTLTGFKGISGIAHVHAQQFALVTSHAPHIYLVDLNRSNTTTSTSSSSSNSSTVTATPPTSNTAKHMQRNTLLLQTLTVQQPRTRRSTWTPHFAGLAYDPSRHNFFVGNRRRTAAPGHNAGRPADAAGIIVQGRNSQKVSSWSSYVRN